MNHTTSSIGKVGPNQNPKTECSLVRDHVSYESNKLAIDVVISKLLQTNSTAQPTTLQIQMTTCMMSIESLNIGPWYQEGCNTQLPLNAQVAGSCWCCSIHNRYWLIRTWKQLFHHAISIFASPASSYTGKLREAGLQVHMLHNLGIIFQFKNSSHAPSRITFSHRSPSPFPHLRQLIASGVRQFSALIFNNAEVLKAPPRHLTFARSKP